MAILVLGRRGQLARELALLDGQDGLSLMAMGREGLDITDESALARVIGEGAWEGVINAAAYTAVDHAEAEPEVAAALNARAPGRIAALCVRHGLPLVHVSTDYVFDGQSDRLLREDDPTGPLSVYGRTKLAGEQAVRDSGAAAIVLRLSWVFSPFGKNFLKTMIKLGRQHECVRVVADQTGTPTPAAAAARACVIALRRLRREPSLGGVYHFAGSPPVSWAGFATAIFAAAGMDVRVDPITTQDYPTAARRPASSGLDSSRFMQVFGLPAPDWRKALPAILERLQAEGIDP